MLDKEAVFMLFYYIDTGSLFDRQTFLVHTPYDVQLAKVTTSWGFIYLIVNLSLYE